MIVVIIVLGGDDISEYYGIIRLLDILLRLRYLLGQSIGPMQSLRIGLARKVLGRMDKIYHRGWRNHNYVTQVLKGENNSSFSSDLAFLDLARQNEAFDIEKYNIQHQRYITFVPSGFWAGYSNNYEAYLEGLIGIANYITQKCEALDMRMVLLPHVLRWTDDVRFVKERVNKLGNNRIVEINDVLLPFQARAILGSSYFVVTQKMH